VAQQASSVARKDGNSAMDVFSGFVTRLIATTGTFPHGTASTFTTRTILEHVLYRMARGYQWPGPSVLSLNPNFSPPAGQSRPVADEGCFIQPKCEQNLFPTKDRVRTARSCVCTSNQREAIEAGARTAARYVA